MLNNLLIHGPRVVAAAAMLLTLAGAPAEARHGADDGLEASASPQVVASPSTSVSPAADDRSGRKGNEPSGKTQSGLQSVNRDTNSGKSGRDAVKASDDAASPRPSREPRSMPEAPSLPSPKPSVSPSGKLDDRRRAVCEKNEAKAERIMTRVVTRAQAQSLKIATISQRVQAFYAAQGNTLAGYQALVSATTTAGGKVQADIAALKTQDAIDCSGDDVTGTVTGFKTSAATLATDLRAYRASVKALIVGVKSVNPEAAPSASPAASSRPTTPITPKATEAN